MKNERIKVPAAFLLWIVLVFLDQYTKYLAARFLKPNGPVILVRNVLELRYLENRGAAFGMLQNRQWIFIVSALICVFVCAWAGARLAARHERMAIRICLAILAAGAAGNLIDRAFRGYVVDFIYFSLIHFPIFNLADVCVSLGTALLVILILFFDKDTHSSSEAN